MDRDSTVKTATARATEAIEAAEMMFADEMGAVLDLSPAARMALIEKITAAIQTAVAEVGWAVSSHASPRQELPPFGAAHLFEAQWHAVLYKKPAILNDRSSFWSEAGDDRTPQKSLSMLILLARLIKDDRGATAIEYGLIAALIAVGSLVAMNTVSLSLNLTTTFSKVAAKLWDVHCRAQRRRLYAGGEYPRALDPSPLIGTPTEASDPTRRRSPPISFAYPRCRQG
jgi:pilus assembly protein Flp/PilA